MSFVAGSVRAGTVSGVGKALKAHRPEVEIVAVEPDASPVLSGGTAAPHKIQGIGAGFVPETYDGSVVDRILRVTNEEAIAATRELAAVEGMLCGISSGAAFSAALRLAADEAYAGKPSRRCFPTRVSATFPPVFSIDLRRQNRTARSNVEKQEIEPKTPPFLDEIAQFLSVSRETSPASSAAACRAPLF